MCAKCLRRSVILSLQIHLGTMEITGKELVEMGYRPGKWFKKAIAEVNAKQLEGDRLRSFLDDAAPKIIDPHVQPPFYSKNIRPEQEEERENVKRVFETMDAVMLTPTAVKGAVMPDACPAGPIGQIPVGGIVATKNAIHPAMHSADICCSVMMTSFGYVEPKKVMNAAHSITHFGGGPRKDPFDLPVALEDRMKGNFFLNNQASMSVAKGHMGTQGDGNHFLFVGQSAKTGETIMVTHHGSRGLGANLYKNGMRLAESLRQEISPKTSKGNGWIPYDSERGKSYWEALQLVRAWTKTNHESIHDATLALLKVDMKERFWNEHNFVFKEGDLFYHAKGATPLSDAFVPDSYQQLRLIPLNMSEPVLIVKGETTDSNLGFAPHGAGRNMSRSKHKRLNADRSIDAIFAEETKGLDIRFYSNQIDISELPSAYKKADSVREQMKEFELGTIVDEIIPYGSIMAGDWQIDAPWRRKNRKSKK